MKFIINILCYNNIEYASNLSVSRTYKRAFFKSYVLRSGQPFSIKTSISITDCRYTSLIRIKNDYRFFIFINYFSKAGTFKETMKNIKDILE
jgi:hypothetical protein